MVILPLGAIEQHGPHLPLLVDWRGAEELAYRIAPLLAKAGWRPAPVPMTLRGKLIAAELVRALENRARS